MKSTIIQQLVIPAVGATLWFSTVASAVDEAATRQLDQQQSAASGRAASPKEDSSRIELENAVLKMIVIPRTREQMKAFYEGRGFPKQAISAIAEACFMTVIVKNKTNKVLWLELNHWQIAGSEANVKRLDRDFWKQRWESLNVPMANRSTFGWTLLPERRDLRTEEGVGGNITMTYSEQPFKLIAQFSRGEDKQESPITVQLEQLKCIK